LWIFEVAAEDERIWAGGGGRAKTITLVRMAKAPEPEKVGTRERFKQIGMVISFTAKRDKTFVPLAAGAALLPIVVALVLILVVGISWIWLAAGVVLALLFFMIVLNIRSQKAMMSEASGQPGAVASLIENMRGDWRVTPAVASTTQFDMVHLVIGRAGVILVAEGNPARLKSLLGQEKRRLSKVIGTADLHDLIIGDGEGQVPLSKVRMTLMRMPRTITAKDVNALSVRLKALTARPQMPKGAIPKNMRPQTGAFRAPRGR
jgi:hypothetical protein